MDDEIKHDVREIRADVKELVKQGAVHNSLLKEHEKRSTSLETRISPLEKDFHLRTRMFAVLFGSGGLYLLIELVRSFLQ